MKKISAEKEEIYLAHFDKWALPIIRDIVNTYHKKYKSRLPKEELINEAFVFYRKRCIKELKNVDEPLLIFIIKSHIYAYILVNDMVASIPGGTITKEDGMEKAKKVLALLRSEELFYKESAMKKDIKIDYESVRSKLSSTERIILVSILLGHPKASIIEILKASGIKNPRKAIDIAESRFVKSFSEAGYS